jgi:hypothetical protein
MRASLSNMRGAPHRAKPYRLSFFANPPVYQDS